MKTPRPTKDRLQFIRDMFETAAAFQITQQTVIDLIAEIDALQAEAISAWEQLARYKCYGVNPTPAPPDLIRRQLWCDRWMESAKRNPCEPLSERTRVANSAVAEYDARFKPAA